MEINGINLFANEGVCYLVNLSINCIKFFAEGVCSNMKKIKELVGKVHIEPRRILAFMLAMALALPSGVLMNWGGRSKGSF